MITKNIPSDWRALQTEVARLLGECGFTAEVEAKVETVRGNVELDILAQENVNGRRYVVACECKHWRETRVPQTVVHAFRTVIGDIGANAGYLISLAGFQSGAYEASKRTNLRLVTWDEFLNEFEPTWYDAYFVQEIDRRLSPIMTYAEPFLPAWFSKLSAHDQTRYMKLKEKYDLFGMVAQSFGPWLRMIGEKGPPPSLPLVERLTPHPLMETIPRPILEEHAYREFLELCTAHGQVALAEFRELRDNVCTVADDP